MKRKHFLNCDVAGFTYYDGPVVFGRLQPGAALQLVAEPENRYDPNAIAVYIEEHKLGFIPRSENKTISLLFEQGYGDIFEAYINRVSPDERPESQIGMVVYVKKR